jgi:hypothetical protein
VHLGEHVFFLEPHALHFDEQESQALRHDCVGNYHLTDHRECARHHNYLLTQLSFPITSLLWPQRAQPHISYAPHHIKEFSGSCGVPDVFHDKHGVPDHDHDHYHEARSDTHHFDQIAQSLPKLEMSHMGSQFFDGIKYVEVAVFNDKGRFNQFGSVAAVEASSLTLMNIVNRRYTNANLNPPIRVVVVAQVTIDGSNNDRWAAPTCNDKGEISFDDLLDNFLSYSWSSAVRNSLPSFDHTHLFTRYDLCGATVGYAPVSSICTPGRSGGISQITFADQQSANIVSHELGHNFNMLHDGVDNGCDPSDFIMASSGCLSCSSFATEFSSCSRTYFESLLFFRPGSSTCLDNSRFLVFPLDNTVIVPLDKYGSPVCGDGFLDDNEECDCGSSDCSSVDPCCVGSTCQLISGAECSNSEPCCESCKIVSASANKICRSAFHPTCDVVETCDGTSASCPLNVIARPGDSCSSAEAGTGKCWKGGCMSQALQCKGLYVPTSGACSTIRTCSEALQCTYNGVCTSFDVSPQEGTPCGTGLVNQCSNNQCRASSFLAFSWFTYCQLSCSNPNSVIRELRCRDYTGQLVPDSSCSGITRPALSRCGSFAPQICSLTASTVGNLSVAPTGQITIDWTTVGSVKFASLLLQSQELSWPSYIEPGYVSGTANGGTYAYIVDRILPPGAYEVKLIVSSSQEATSNVVTISCAVCLIDLCLLSDINLGWR